MAAYNDTPLATDIISDSQAPIRENFNSIESAWNVNHVDITAAGSTGMHQKIDFPRQAAQPTAAGTDLTLYNFLNPDSTLSELYVRRNGSNGIPFTASGAGVVGPDAYGWAYLPAGLLMKYGWHSGLGGGDVVFTNNTAPYFTQINSTVITPIVGMVADQDRTILLREVVVRPAGFDLKLKSVRRLSAANITCSFYWMIIGR